jgi:PhoPQ-activated pathogenicity-related protein
MRTWKTMAVAMTIGMTLAAMVPAARADVFEYVQKPDKAFSWKLNSVKDVPQGKVYDLHMVSQVWEGITWQHQIQIYEPKELKYPDVMGLMITGGHASPDSIMLGMMAAGMMGMRLAVLYDIPNQPLFNGLGEDALISYTWVKYIETGDENWPCLFPMVKASVRAMDVLEKVAAEQWKQKLRGFMVTGASKRGWTTYLTSEVDNKRVIAMAPMVFDILNMPVNIQHQLDFWGDFSVMIKDYTEKGFMDVMDTGRAYKLQYIVDPYSYRTRLTMPKLIVLGSNDPYWPTDAVNFYWPGLEQPKFLLIDPNSKHGLDDKMRVLATTASFFRMVASGAEFPKIRWQWTETADGAQVTVTVSPKPVEARMWIARNNIRDFRPVKWDEEPMTADGEKLVGKVAMADGQHTAAYGEIVWEIDGQKMYVSTTPKILPPKPGP